MLKYEVKKNCFGGILWYNVKIVKNLLQQCSPLVLLIKKPYSASTMFVTHGIPFFTNYFALPIIWFTNCVSKNSISIILTCKTLVVYNNSLSHSGMMV